MISIARLGGLRGLTFALMRLAMKSLFIRSLLVSSLSATALWAGACADAVGQEDTDLKPQIIGLSKSAVSVGQSIDILGANFAHGHTGYAVVLLEGEYHAKSGATYPVSYEVRPHWEDGNRLVWSHVGPYRVPFSPTGDETGTFVGTGTVINVDEDGTEYFSEPADVELEILPSVIVTSLAPVESDCAEPSKVILDNFAYKVGVKAIGFEPRNFTYVVDSPFQTIPKVMRTQATSAASTFGEGGEIVFPLVPEDRPFYRGALVVAALDQNDVEHAIALSIGVHRPVEYVMYDAVEIAEIEAPQPVSGCIAGGENEGLNVSYSESQSETRSRTVGATWNEEWVSSHTGTISESRTSTNSIGITISESTEEGEELNYENGRDIEGGGGVTGGFKPFGIGVEVSANGKYTDVSRDGGRTYKNTTSGYTVAEDFSQSDTESWAYSNTAGYNLQKGGSDFFTVSSSDSTIVSFAGRILPGQYGVFYRQTTRMALPGAVLAYNRCGIAEVVAETNFYDYTWSVDLAVDADCQELPESNLPKAECFIAPCSGVQ